jgi:hypothetical protein
MAARAAERTACRKAAEPPVPPEPDMPPGHEGHHRHVRWLNGIDCSCGQALGCFSVVPDPRYWSDDPAVRAQAGREEVDFAAWLTCRLCGAHGVMADEDFGVWPPRNLTATP